MALVAALAMGAGALKGGDPVAAQALYERAERVAGEDFTDGAWLDAAREAARVRPWQPGYAQARQHLATIEQGRNAARPR